jgi:DNA-binding NtrC family response regulator
MHPDIQTTARWQVAFGSRGHDVRRARSCESAEHQLREDRFDLLLFDFLFGGESCLSTALVAQFHQPHMVSVLMSDSAPEIQGDMYARLASLRCILGTETSASDLVAICEELTKGASHRASSNIGADRARERFEGGSQLDALEALYRGARRREPQARELQV